MIFERAFTSVGELITQLLKSTVLVATRKVENLKPYEFNAFDSFTKNFLMSCGASEWVNKRAKEWAQRSARAKWIVQSKRMSERGERRSEQRSERPNTLNVAILLNLRWSWFFLADMAF